MDNRQKEEIRSKMGADNVGCVPRKWQQREAWLWEVMYTCAELLKKGSLMTCNLAPHFLFRWASFFCFFYIYNKMSHLRTLIINHGAIR